MGTRSEARKPGRVGMRASGLRGVGVTWIAGLRESGRMTATTTDLDHANDAPGHTRPSANVILCSRAFAEEGG